MSGPETSRINRSFTFTTGGRCSSHALSRFVCLMSDADIEVVAAVAERMRALVAALPPRTLGNDTQTITLSAGVLSRIPRAGESAADLLREADTALYRAKHEGRNRVCAV